MKKKRDPRKCVKCGAEFIPYNWIQKLCSVQCRFEVAPSRPLKLRFDVFNRDNFRCVYCGRSPKIHGVVLQLDHVKPKNYGGRDIEKNLVTACEECNRGKTDKLLNKPI